MNCNTGGKHAFLIGAFKNPDYLLKLVDSLDSEKSNFYIHVNRYNDCEFNEFRNNISSRINIHYYSIYKIKWGGSDMFFSQMFLLDKALKDYENEYFHFITGQDILIRPLNEFMFYVEECKANFLNYFIMQPSEWNYRYSYYSLYDILDIRSNWLLKKINSLFVRTQEFLHIKRTTMRFKQMYGGSGWWSLRKDACQYLVSKWCEDKAFQKRIRFTHAPDEMLFQTYLLNSEKNIPIINDNLRYIMWEGNSSPKTLTIDDYDDIIQSEKYLARKIDPIASQSLIEKINRLKI